MPIDFTAMPRGRSAKRPVHPVELFHGLKISDPMINDLWLAQGDALREWNEVREQTDIAIVLNTGAGKTLVGLLAAQSLVHEMKGHVIYTCSSIQLVEQTAEKAAGYGLDFTTYFRGDFSNDLYQRALAPCITTYHAVFNGKSRFLNDECTAMVFDDAHTAEHLLRDQFTVKIIREETRALYTGLFELFRGYFTRVGLQVGYAELERPDIHKCWLVPPFAVRERLAELQRLLLSADLHKSPDTMFSWEHLKDHLEACAVLVSAAYIALTPPVVPIRTLPYFQNTTRRIYLSATLTAADGFLRTFGRIPTRTIAPETPAGACERLFIYPPKSAHGSEDLQVSKALITKEKALILVPSYVRAHNWDDVAGHRSGADTTKQVELFKQASSPATLVLVSRYDGIDLPGDTCHILVMDGLPAGIGPLETYLWQHLRLMKGLRTTIASRIAQSFGRITRGISDYGVVILVGKDLLDWLRVPANIAALPRFLQSQLELSTVLSKSITSTDSMADAVHACLTRDLGWTTYYQARMDDLAGVGPMTPDEGAVALAEVEVEFGHSLWDRDYLGAAKQLRDGLDATFKTSRNSGAWHALWLGYCHELLGDPRAARRFYDRAHGAQKAIPPFELQGMADQQPLSPQVQEVFEYLHEDGRIRVELLQRVDSDLAVISGNGTPAQTEEAIRALGMYLGLVSSRPDDEYGTGPDVLWLLPSDTAWSMEVKTAKQKSPYYTKYDLGQLRDHKRWVYEHSSSTVIHSTFIGQLLSASPEANPDPDIEIMELKEFHALAQRLRAALTDICAVAVPATLGKTILDVFGARDLLWPGFFQTLTRHALVSIGSK